MPENSRADEQSGLFDTLLLPLRLPGRVVGEIESVTRALLSLQRSAEVHLASVDKNSGDLVAGLTGLRASVARLEGKVDALTGLEATIEERMDGLRKDLNTRLLAVEAEVREMRPALEQMSRDVQTIERLLPNPADGPIARLRDTLTSS
jgi:chromosome segregation ATPase